MSLQLNPGNVANLKQVARSLYVLVSNAIELSCREDPSFTDHTLNHHRLHAIN